MDEDTTFPVLSLGEQILGKYSYRPCCGYMETIVILTNYRLLIRRKYIFCCCCSRSTYTAIALDSIDRVDDIPAYSSLRYIIIMIMLFLLSIVWLAFGAVERNTASIVFSVLFMFVIIGGLILGFFLKNYQWVSMKGTFGSEAFILEQCLARELEGRLLEMCYQRQMAPSSQAIPQFGQAGVAPPPSYGATPFVVRSKE